MLGCTSARLTSKSHHDDDSGYDAIVYIGDGRFHLESAMIHNPELPAYKYDPYSRKFTIEKYDHDEMYSLRREAISKARSANKIGIILGSLGRQEMWGTLERIQNGFKQQKNIESVVVLLSEIFPGKLAQFPDVDCWVQVACPRLSIDWGYAFPRPLLTPYEAMVALDLDDDWSSIDGGAYPMDYYSKDGYGRGNKRQELEHDLIKAKTKLSDQKKNASFGMASEHRAMHSVSCRGELPDYTRSWLFILSTCPYRYVYL